MSKTINFFLLLFQKTNGATFAVGVQTIDVDTVQYATLRWADWWGIQFGHRSKSMCQSISLRFDHKYNVEIFFVHWREHIVWTSSDRRYYSRMFWKGKNNLHWLFVKRHMTMYFHLINIFGHFFSPVESWNDRLEWIPIHWALATTKHQILLLHECVGPIASHQRITEHRS